MKALQLFGEKWKVLIGTMILLSLIIHEDPAIGWSAAP
jgi:hypothetical protein